MNDRYLLVLAARACGFSLGFTSSGVLEDCWTTDGSTPRHYFGNPLEDDGDAFRLAARLNLYIQNNFDDEHGNNFACSGIENTDRHEGGNNDEAIWVSCVSEGSDRFAATRRAVVIAAAYVAANPIERQALPDKH